MGNDPFSSFLLSIYFLIWTQHFISCFVLYSLFYLFLFPLSSFLFVSFSLMPPSLFNGSRDANNDIFSELLNLTCYNIFVAYSSWHSLFVHFYYLVLCSFMVYLFMYVILFLPSSTIQKQNMIRCLISLPCSLLIKFSTEYDIEKLPSSHMLVIIPNHRYFRGL